MGIGKSSWMIFTNVRNPHQQQLKEGYLVRVMACLALSLLVVLSAVKFWPALLDDEPADITYNVRGQEVIAIEEIVPTQQELRKPPPPAPLPPIVVPDDVILEDVDFDIKDSPLAIDEYGEDAEVSEGDVQGPVTAAPAAQTAPKPVRFVEPEYTREAQRKRIRAEVVVEVLVDERGRVQDARILERYLLDKDHEREAVGELGFGLEESALSAAERWMFRPARENGRPVRSFTQLTIKFGV